MPTDTLQLEEDSSGIVSCTVWHSNKLNLRVRFLENNHLILSTSGRISTKKCPSVNNLTCDNVELSISSQTINNSRIVCDYWNLVTGEIIVTSDPVIVTFVPAIDPPTSTGQPTTEQPNCTQPNCTEPTTEPSPSQEPSSSSSSGERSKDESTNNVLVAVVIILSVTAAVEAVLLLLCAVMCAKRKCNAIRDIEVRTWGIPHPTLATLVLF